MALSTSGHAQHENTLRKTKYGEPSLLTSSREVVIIGRAICLSSQAWPHCPVAVETREITIMIRLCIWRMRLYAANWYENCGGVRRLRNL